MGNSFDFKDYLEVLSPSEVMAWYLRLADSAERKYKTVKNPLSPLFLRHYIKGGGKRLTFDPPDHLVKSKYVVSVLKDHRAWYLTEKRFKGKWVGIIPRMQANKVPASPYRQLVMDMRSLVEIDVKIIGSNTDGDNDLLASLHGFQLLTMCYVYIRDIPNDDEKKVIFSSFTAFITDRYDFDPDKFFRLPNPDYNNAFKVAKPVAPDNENITVYHKNAIRMEKAGLAKPFDLASNGWAVTDLSIMGDAKVDPNKDLNRPW